MKTYYLAATAALALVAGTHAATPPAEDEHAAHHPTGAVPAPTVDAAKVDQQMKVMHEMHEMHDKMMAAKSPEERAALMQEHMKAMQDGMAMMGQMRADKNDAMPMGHDMMHRRMDMMETMMQMMMDRQGMQAPAK